MPSTLPTYELTVIKVIVSETNIFERLTPFADPMYVSIKQLVPVSNLDRPLPGAADAVSIKNRWYIVKGWYSAVQTP